MLSTDRKLFDSNSAVAARMIEYGKVLGDLRIIVLAGHQPTKILSDNVAVYSTNSFSRLFYLTDAIGLIIKLNRLAKADGVTPKSSGTKVDWISAQDPFETGLAAWVANIFVKTKLQFQLHTDVFSPFFAQSSFLNRCRVILAKFLLPKADHIRVVSQKIFKSLTEGPLTLPKEKITVLPVLVDGGELRVKENLEDLRQKYPRFEKIILMASRFEPEKDFVTALRSFKQIVAKWPKAGLIIVGAGSEKSRITKLINSFGLVSNVVVEPWTDNLFSYFKMTDIYLLTSLFEGYGRTLVEAGIAGVPFVSTDVGCAKELVDLGLRGLVVPVRDWRAIGESLNTLLAGEKTQNIVLPNSVHFLSKEKFLELYKKSFEALS
jgi:glycosyltransferase involved in cell wall biosynthesis